MLTIAPTLPFRKHNLQKESARKRPESSVSTNSVSPPCFRDFLGSRHGITTS